MKYRCMKCEGQKVELHGLECKEGCGEIYDIDSPSIHGLRICGKDGHCDKCSQASSKANSEDQE